MGRAGGEWLERGLWGWGWGGWVVTVMSSLYWDSKIDMAAKDPEPMVA